VKAPVVTLTEQHCPPWGISQTPDSQTRPSKQQISEAGVKHDPEPESSLGPIQQDPELPQLELDEQDEVQTLPTPHLLRVGLLELGHAATCLDPELNAQHWPPGEVKLSGMTDPSNAQHAETVGS